MQAHDYPLYAFGSPSEPPDGKRLILFGVGNGFPPPLYAPLLQPLTERARVISLLPRALWPQPQPLSATRSWLDIVADVRAGMRTHHLAGAVVMGHSGGAIVSLVAAAEDPAMFRALVLLDPTIFVPPVLWRLGRMRAAGLVDQMPLVASAARRRSRFDSIDEAVTFWSGRSLFQDWPEVLVRWYAENVLQPALEGGFELRWSPAWESHYYATILTSTWRYVGRLRAHDLPILILRGETSTTYLPDAAAMMRRVLPKAAHVEIRGHGHLFPLTAADETRAHIEGWLSEQRLL